MNHDITSARIDRRHLFRVGGLTLGAAALLAACAENEYTGPLGRVGNGPDTPTLQDPVLDDSVLLRTAASIELSIAAAYDTLAEKGWLSGSTTYASLGDQSELVATFAAHHRAAADTFNSLAVEAGGEAWTCANPRLDSAFIDVIVTRVESGAEATDSAKAIEASDDAGRDAIHLVNTLEELSAETCQALVAQVTQASMRKASMAIGVRSARQAAYTALLVNPGGYVMPEAAAAAQPATPAPTTVPPTPAVNENGVPLTEIPLPVAVPSQFGSLAPITYIGGNGDENGVRLKLNFETPSLNSFVYPFDTCA